MTAVHVVTPDGVDDPTRPSGGNTYNRQVCGQLGSLGWSVHEYGVPGPWPHRDEAGLGALSAAVGRIADDSLVLVDGLVASTAPEVLVPEAGRLRLVVLVHMPLGDRPPADAAGDIRRREAAVLHAATAVVTTSQWSRRRLGELYQLPLDRMHVAEPGVAVSDLATGTADGGALLCVAAVTFEKGHDVLLDALRRLPDLSWSCTCVGSLDRDPGFVSTLGPRGLDGELRGRVQMAGPRTGVDLERSYATADLVVLPSRAETYGMVITEALARGLPVVAADVGGVTEAMGATAEGLRPGLLVAPGDVATLAAALREWIGDAGLRERLRRAARERRNSLPRWPGTASVVAGILRGASR